MKLYYNKTSSDPVYYGQVGFRNGKKTTTKNVIRFGKHSELLKITDDPEAYCRQKIKEWNEEHRCGRESIQMNFDFNRPVDHASQKVSDKNEFNIGYFILQETMSGLRLKEFFHQMTADRKFTFDCFTINRFLTYARILDPMSKHATWDTLSSYYEKPDFEYQHILRFMDLLEEHHDDYLAWLYKNSCNVVHRDTSVLYYDCSNFYCECEKEDDEIVDEATGEVISGLRQYGISKEHRPNPIVEMGLFMDRQGIPVTMSLHPGNESESLTAIPLEKTVLKILENSQVIYVADAGLGTYGIRQFNSMGGRAFIVTQSLKKISDVLKQAVFNDYDYRLLSTDEPISIKYMKEFDRTSKENLALYQDSAYKVINADHAVDLGLYEWKKCKNGTMRRVKVTGELKQRLIVTFSRKMMEYQRAVRNRQIGRAMNLLQSGDPENIKKGPNDVKRFLKRVSKTASGEKVTIQYELDEDKIAEEERYDGYYAVATNLDDPARDILCISHQRHKIENCFRIMKTDLSARPIYHQLPNRIKAHFLICYTALLVQRLLEVRLDEQGTHATTRQIIDQIQNMTVSNIGDVAYQASYRESNTLHALTKLTDLQLDRYYYQPTTLNKMLKKISR